MAGSSSKSTLGSETEIPGPPSGVCADILLITVLVRRLHDVAAGRTDDFLADTLSFLMPTVWAKKFNLFLRPGVLMSRKRNLLGKQFP